MSVWPAFPKRRTIMRILLVEDDHSLGDALEERFLRESYAVDWVRKGTDALHALASGEYSLVVLDLGLPEMDGLTALSHIRTSGNQTPVIILTAQDAVLQRVAGLDRGADDYLIKPFDMTELLARCRALMRRGGTRIENVLRVGDVQVDRSSHMVSVGDRVVNVPPHEFRLLVHLAERRGRVVTRLQLEEALYGWSEGAESNTLEVYISQLRRKIGAHHIRTLRGIGYMMP